MAKTRTSATGNGAAGGFTLTELLVVFAVLGIVMALAVPNLGRVLPGLELRTDARTVASALHEARSLAISRNLETTLTIDVEQRSLRLGEGAPVQLSPELTISLLVASSNTSGLTIGGITFFPDGTSTGGSVTLALGERQQHVVVDWITGTASVVQ